MTAQFVVDDIPEDEHGTATAYQHRKCRCETCRAWNAARSRHARYNGRQRQANGKGEVSFTVAFDETTAKERPSTGYDWRADAACKGKPHEWWFPASTRAAEWTAPHAAAICRHDCPVRDECGTHADAWGEPGIWGGVFRYTPNERDQTVQVIAAAVGASKIVRLRAG